MRAGAGRETGGSGAAETDGSGAHAMFFPHALQNDASSGFDLPQYWQNMRVPHRHAMLGLVRSPFGVFHC